MVSGLSGCVIVSGMPGAGKSTVTGLAARRLPKAAQVRGDDMNQMIKSGYVGWMDRPADEALRQDELCNRNMCSLANNFIDFSARHRSRRSNVPGVAAGWHTWLRRRHGI